MMPFLLSLSFVAFAVTSAFLQASDHQLKKVVSPALTAFCGLIVCYGTLVGTVSWSHGLTIAAALFLLAASDAFFERSADNSALFPVAMTFGVLSGFAFGILFNIVARQAGVPMLLQSGCFVLGIVAALLVYRFLEVAPSLKGAVMIYLAQAVILLAGGVASIFAGPYPFAVWGILLFVSDSLVGLRAFPHPERHIVWLNPSRILLAILVLYYSAQYAMVFWAL